MKRGYRHECPLIAVRVRSRAGSAMVTDMGAFPPGGDAPRPARRVRPWLIAVIAAAVVLVIGIIVAVAFAVGAFGPATVRGSGKLSEPIDLLPVSRQYDGPCKPGDLPAVDTSGGGQCFAFDRGMTIASVTSIEARANETGQPIVRIELQSADAQKFSALTTRLASKASPQNQLAIIVGDSVVSAPAVATPIPGPELDIAGSFTQKETEDLVERITTS